MLHLHNPLSEGCELLRNCCKDEVSHLMQIHTAIHPKAFRNGSTDECRLLRKKVQGLLYKRMSPRWAGCRRCQLRRVRALTIALVLSSTTVNESLPRTPMCSWSSS